MEFLLTEEEKMFQATVRDFVDKELQPVAIQIDKEDEIPSQIPKRMAKLGFYGIAIPKEYGGSGGDFVCRTIMAEELSRASAGTALQILASPFLACGPIQRSGTKEQKQRYLSPVAKGEKLACFAQTEPNVGSDPSKIETVATRDGDYYIINGTKTFITNGDAADFAVVIATIDKSLGARGITIIIVERSTPGFSSGPKMPKVGQHGSVQTDLYFENCRVPVANRVGEEGRGLRLAFNTVDSTRPQIAGISIGISRGAFDLAFDYALKRKQFGQAIVNHEAIQWMLADMVTGIQAAKLLAYNASGLEDRGLPFAIEAAAAKLFASEMSRMVTNNAIQIHGGVGYRTDYHVERYWRDARVTEIYEGTSEMQRLTIAAEMLRSLKKS